MSDPRAFQQQFEAFMAMYQEDRARERAEREREKLANEARQNELTVQLEELSREVAASRIEGRRNGTDYNHGVSQEPRAETPERGNFVPRYTKLDFPRYDGTSDPLGWLSRCDHFFLHQRTALEDKVGLASFHLEGDAQLWFIKLERDRPQLTWEDFKTNCNLRFGPPV